MQMATHLQAWEDGRTLHLNIVRLGVQIEAKAMPTPKSGKARYYFLFLLVCNRKDFDFTKWLTGKRAWAMGSCVWPPFVQVLLGHLARVCALIAFTKWKAASVSSGLLCATLTRTTFLYSSQEEKNNLSFIGILGAATWVQNQST